MLATRTARPFAALVALLIVPGCGQPETPYVPVKLKVTLNGKPLPRGAVSLRPTSVPGGEWEQPTGSVSGDGDCTLYTDGKAGARPGEYRVVVFATEDATPKAGSAAPGMPKSILPTKYNDPHNSPLRLTVPANPSPQPLPVELTSP
jgi:hypothetical protein